MVTSYSIHTVRVHFSDHPTYISSLLSSVLLLPRILFSVLLTHCDPFFFSSLILPSYSSFIHSSTLLSSILLIFSHPFFYSSLIHSSHSSLIHSFFFLIINHSYSFPIQSFSFPSLIIFVPFKLLPYFQFLL